MRHSFTGYWLAVHKNAPALAETMDNTAPIIRKHYENTVLEGCGGQIPGDPAVKMSPGRPSPGLQ